MPTVSIELSELLEAKLRERMRCLGASSAQEYLLSLVVADCEAGEFERQLAERSAGPFAPLEPDWAERVRSAAAKQQE